MAGLVPFNRKNKELSTNTEVVVTSTTLDDFFFQMIVIQTNTLLRHF